MENAFHATMTPSQYRMSQYSIEITDRQENSCIELGFLKLVICRVLSEEGVESAKISIALVDDAEIHEVNRRFLGHDYPTDVISFRFDEQSSSSARSESPHPEDAIDSEEISADFTQSIEGELIVSFETAIREASVHGWSPEAEMLLYVVHGILHLCGYDDLTDEARPVMRSRERELLAIWGFCPTGLEP